MTAVVIMKKKEVQIPVRVYLEEDTSLIEPKNQIIDEPASVSEEKFLSLSTSLPQEALPTLKKEASLQKKLLFMRVGVFIIVVFVFITWAVGLAQNKFFDLKLSTTKSLDDFKKTLSDSLDNFSNNWQHYQPGNLLEQVIPDNKKIPVAENTDKPEVGNKANDNILNKNNIFEIEP